MTIDHADDGVSAFMAEIAAAPLPDTNLAADVIWWRAQLRRATTPPGSGLPIMDVMVGLSLCLASGGACALLLWQWPLQTFLGVSAFSAPVGLLGSVVLSLVGVLTAARRALAWHTR